MIIYKDFKRKGNKWISQKIRDIEGSSIYGCNTKILFSKIAEPDGRDSSLEKLCLQNEEVVLKIIF